MTLDDFLRELAGLGVELWVDGDRLRFKSVREALTPARLEQLKAHKEALIERLRRQGGSLRRHPLSYGQRSLWFLHQVAPDTDAYNVAYTCRIRARVDAAAMRRAFARLIARHAALRTRFVEAGGEPFQQIDDAVPVNFTEHAVPDCPLADLQRLVSESYRRPFDLSRAPLMRGALFTRAEDDHILLIALHHLVCDGWSVMLLVEELGRYHAEEAAGKPGTDSAPAPSYAEFTHWQHQRLEQPAAARELDYWSGKLSGSLPALDLPTDFARPAVPALRGACQSFRLEGAEVRRIREVAQAHGATLYMFLAAAFQLLLHRTSNQTDILIGSPVTGRAVPGFAGMIGHLVNSIVLRADFSANPSFSDFLTRVRADVLASMEHQDYPFALLVEKLQPRRDLSRSPIFQAMVVVHKGGEQGAFFGIDAASDQPSGDLTWGGLRIEPFGMAQQEGQFDVTLEVVDAGDTLNCLLKYNAEIFEPARMAAMAGHFRTLVAAACAEPAMPVGQASHAFPGRTRNRAGALEHHRRAVAGGSLRPSTVRRTRAPGTRPHRPGVRGDGTDLPPTRRTGGTAGNPPARVGRWAGRVGCRVPETGTSVWWWRCWRS
jgi:hypothetical protein